MASASIYSCLWKMLFQMECSLHPVTWAPSLSGSSGMSTFGSASLQDRRLELAHQVRSQTKKLGFSNTSSKGLFWSLNAANIRQTHSDSTASRELQQGRESPVCGDYSCADRQVLSLYSWLRLMNYSSPCRQRQLIWHYFLVTFPTASFIHKCQAAEDWSGPVWARH